MSPFEGVPFTVGELMHHLVTLLELGHVSADTPVVVRSMSTASHGEPPVKIAHAITTPSVDVLTWSEHPEGGDEEHGALRVLVL